MLPSENLFQTKKWPPDHLRWPNLTLSVLRISREETGHTEYDYPAVVPLGYA